MAYCLARQSADTLLVGTTNGIWQYAISSGQVAPLRCSSQGFFTRGMRIQSLTVRPAGVSYTTNEGFFVWERSGASRKVYPSDSTKLNIYTHTYEGDSVYLATMGRGLVILDASARTSRILRTE